ncbi:MAG: ATP-binding protein [Nitrospirota bacterium]
MNMLDLPTTKEEIERLVSSRVPEDIHLDYKQSEAIDHSKRDEIAKDVSAFANSDGGLIIYGVIEQGSSPLRIDDGVDHQKFSREWLEQIIGSRITPRVDDVKIAQIPLSSDRSLYTVLIPKSFRGPHQSPSKHYYKRYNFASAPMEDYEINDVRQRRRTVLPLVSIDVRSRHGALIYLVVSNKGDAPAEDVTFEFPENFDWLNTLAKPNLFTRGIKTLAPGKEFHFLYSQFVEVAKEGSQIPGHFLITASYTHPGIGQQITEAFYIDVLDYFNSEIFHSEIHDTGQTIRQALKDLTNQVERLNGNIEQLVPLADATGLSLSLPTLKNLQHLFRGEQDFERINPAGCGTHTFREVLGIDIQMALRLRRFFADPNPDKNIEEIELINDELIHKVKKYFIL